MFPTLSAIPPEGLRDDCSLTKKPFRPLGFDDAGSWLIDEIDGGAPGRCDDSRDARSECASRRSNPDSQLAPSLTPAAAKVPHVVCSLHPLGGLEPRGSCTPWRIPVSIARRFYSIRSPVMGCIPPLSHLTLCCAADGPRLDTAAPQAEDAAAREGAREGRRAKESLAANQAALASCQRLAKTVGMPAKAAGYGRNEGARSIDSPLRR